MNSKTTVAAISIALALLSTACKPETPPMTTKTPPPLPAGEVWDSHSEFATHWPGAEHPALVRLRDDLILAIPPQNSEIWCRGTPHPGSYLHLPRSQPFREATSPASFFSCPISPG